MAKWKTEKIIDLCDAIYSGGTPNTRKEEYWNGDIKWLSSGETRSDYIYSTEKTISQKGVDNSSTRLANSGSVVMASAGQGYTRGQVSYLYIDTYINQSVIALYANDKKLDAKFLYFNLKNRYNELRAISDANSSRGSITTKMLADLKIKLPPLPTQRKIAAILSALDDKIENNRKTAEKLEEIAAAVFKRWFADFEFPDAKGKPYKSNGGKMVECELGLIPEGWEVKSVLDIAEVIGGGTPKTTVEEYWNGDIPWFSVVDAPDNIFVIDTEKHISKAGLDNSSTRLLPEGTTIVSARGTVGKCALTAVPMAMNQSCYGIKSPQNHDAFIYMQMLTLVDYLKQSGHGSVFNTITRDTLSKATFAYNQEYAEETNGFLMPLFLMIKKRQYENRALQQTRDTLLPKLISGELSVEDERS